MLVIVAFVLWASLLHVTMEEEKELFDEFPGVGVSKYCKTCDSTIKPSPVADQQFWTLKASM